MPKTLLLADDSVVIRKLISLSFSNKNVELVTADNGDDAIELARSRRPDVVIADVVMPGKNGYEVCEAIKQDPALSHIPVLLLTGTFEAFDDERATAVGALGHITKPFEARALVDRVTKLFSAAREPALTSATEATAGSPFDFLDDDVAPLSNVEAAGVLETTDPLAEPFDGETAVALEPDLEAFDLDTGLLGSNSTVALMAEEAPEPGSELSVALIELDEALDHDDVPAAILAEDLFDAPPSDDASDWLAPPAEQTPVPSETLAASLVDNDSAATSVPVDDLFDAPEHPAATLLDLEVGDAPEPSDEMWLEPSPAEVSSAPAPVPMGQETPSDVPAEAISAAIRERLHETLEKVAWEAFSELSEQVVRQVLERVETIAWEVIPQMTETLIREEIRRLKAEDASQS